MTEGIKICRIFADAYWSLFNDGQAITYKMNEWIKRPEGCGPLAIFKDIESAKKFMLEREDEYVYCNLSKNKKIFFKCEYVESKDKYLWCLHSIIYNAYHEKHELPEGTILVDTLKLVEIIR